MMLMIYLCSINLIIFTLILMQFSVLNIVIILIVLHSILLIPIMQVIYPYQNTEKGDDGL
jgi:hypothetical protein